MSRDESSQVGTAETLYPYQDDGALWLSGKKYALLADEMGLGKSAQAITAADLVQAQSILVVCPAVARMNWKREFEKFSARSLSINVMLSSCDLTSLSSCGELTAPNVTIVSYDLLNSPTVTARLACPWALVILDECHYLKNFETGRTALVLGRRGIVHRTTRLWALSGTPAPNGDPSELWPLLRVVGVTALDRGAFAETYCAGFDGPYGFKVTGVRNVGAWKAMLAPFMLRRKKVDVLKDLPSIQFSDVVIERSEISDEDLELAFTKYNRDPRGVRAAVLADVEEQTRRVESIFGIRDSDSVTKREDILTMLSGCAGSATTVRRYTGMLKVKRVVELVKAELNGGMDKIVLFAIHKDVIENLRLGLSKYGAVTLYGGTNPLTRERNIEKFQKEKRCRVLIMNIQAGGIAITATAAANVLFVESSWVPAENAQAAMRVHRIGQTRPVLVRFVGLVGSIDEQVQTVLRRKTKALSELF